MPVGSIAKATAISSYSAASSGGSSLGNTKRPLTPAYGGSSYSSFGKSGY